MNYHNILHDDMANGDGLRVVLFVSGCSHHCYKCQNHQTWECNSGIEFDAEAEKEILNELSKNYIRGVTLSGGDPLQENNLEKLCELVQKIRLLYGDKKTVWIYTGYTWEQIMNPIESKHEEINRINSLRKFLLTQCNILVDGRYIDELSDIDYKWAGSTNQRVIDIQKSLAQDKIVLWQ